MPGSRGFDKVQLLVAEPDMNINQNSQRSRLANHILSDGFQAQLQPHLPGSISTIRRSTRLLGWVSSFPLFASMMGDAFSGDTQIDDRCCSAQKVLWDV